MASVLRIKITQLLLKTQTTWTISMICLALVFSWSLVMLNVEAVSMVSCAGKSTTNRNHLYRAEWDPTTVTTTLPSFDFYQCIWDTTRQVWLVYSFNCTGSRLGAATAPTIGKYCNYFDESAQQCLLDKQPASCMQTVGR